MVHDWWVCMLYFQCGLLLTVRALIKDLRSEPDNDEGCLLAGSEVKIVCESIAFPVGTVEFIKDSTPVELNDRCVPHVCNSLYHLVVYSKSTDCSYS